MFFVDLVNNYAKYQKNNQSIDIAVSRLKINKEQAILLYANNFKWYETCNHKGLLYIEGQNYYYITRTSKDKLLNLSKSYNEYINKIKNQKAEPITFNDKCKIINKKWVLGNIENKAIEYTSLEDRQDIIVRTVGTQDDLENLKEWVKTLDLKSFDISPYFNIEKTIDEFSALNGKNFIKDE